MQSGAGLHAYFFLTQFLPAPSWILVAKALKAACVRAGFHADPARTADIASLLRCPGTINRKEGRPLYPVQVLKLLSPSTIENLSAPLKQYTYTIEAKPEKALDKLNEVLVATSSTVPGEATAAYLIKRLQEEVPVKVTRLACGIPMGMDIKYADELTLSRAIESRKDTCS